MSRADHLRRHPVGLIVALLACLSSSCMRTTLRSGAMPGEPPPGWEDRWHHSFVLGLVEVPGPIETGQLCPGGWAQIDSELDPLQGALAVLSLGLYTPSTVSVVCAARVP